MTRRPRARPLAPRFLDRLREALSGFADGVHALQSPALATLDELPESFREIYRLSDGLWLFDDAVRVRPLAELAREDGLIVCGHVQEGRLLCDDQGRIFEEDEHGDRQLSAPTIEDELLVRIARESLILDREGEWKEVFDPQGELLVAIVRKRNEVARRRAPLASRWSMEAAELALELDGDEDEATKHLEAAIAADPDAAVPYEVRGSLMLARGELPRGAAMLVTAAMKSASGRRADRAAAAAEACARAGMEEERARMAKLAIDASPSIVQRLAGEAALALEDGRLEDADHLSALAIAVAGNADVLPARLRMRGRLRPIN